MSYVSLENSESFLKCFEVIAEDKSCIVADSVLYLSGKTGKGFVTVAGLAAGIEVLAVNVSMLAEDLVFNFLPSRGESTYILCFDEIDPAAGKADQEGMTPVGTTPSGTGRGSGCAVHPHALGDDEPAPEVRLTSTGSPPRPTAICGAVPSSRWPRPASG